jgi:hypothetical protein
MSKKFESSDLYREKQVGKSYDFTAAAPAPAAGPIGKSGAKKTRTIIISVAACLLIVASAVFALYTATDLFKSNKVVEKRPEASPLTALPEDIASAVKNGDYTSYADKGLDVSSLAAFDPYLIGYNLIVEDETIAIIRGGVLYGLRPGTTTVIVIAQDNGRTVSTIPVVVKDDKGFLDYTVTFEFPNPAANRTFTVISGRSLAESFANFQLPALPDKTGYEAVEWQLEGEKFFGSFLVKSNITVKVKYDPVGVIFASVPEINATYGNPIPTIDLKDFVSAGTGSYIFQTNGPLPAGINFSEEGILNGAPLVSNENAPFNLT